MGFERAGTKSVVASDVKSAFLFGGLSCIIELSAYPVAVGVGRVSYILQTSCPSLGGGKQPGVAAMAGDGGNQDEMLFLGSM